jgi:hypothetical protein
MSTPQTDAAFEREKWEVEKAFRERELGIREREQASREAELELKRNEQARSQWSNPLIVAILAAAIAAIGTTAVALVNGIYARQVEAQRAEEARILEVIKTDDPDKAAVNIKFLLDAGLISDQDMRSKLASFLSQRQSGAGPSLPFSFGPMSPAAEKAIEEGTAAAAKMMEEKSKSQGLQPHN